MDSLFVFFDQASSLQLAIAGVFVIGMWFLPAILALYLNPKHSKFIALACIPAGFSFIAWSTMMIWAITGKVSHRYRNKIPKAKT